MKDHVLSGARSLHRLIYCSRQADSIRRRLGQEVASIVDASVARNGKVGVTGLLLTYDGWFLQALEGEYRAVMTTYGRILNDPRHSGSKIIASMGVEGRAFGAWRMCARELGRSDAAILEVLEGRPTVNVASLTPGAALKLLTTVATIQARAA